MMRPLCRVMAVAAIALMSGCTKMDASPGFADVQKLSSKHGVNGLRWIQDSAADREVAEAVRGLLAAPLTSDRAVQIALLNNRMLQSRYETLNVAQADLVQAGLLKNPTFDGSVRFVEGGGGHIIDLGVAFDFLDLFFIPMRKSVAASEFEGAKLKVTADVLSLAAQTRTTFLSLQAAQQGLELQLTAKGAFEASYDFARRLRAAGNTTTLKLAHEQVSFEESRLAVLRAEEEVAMLREELNILMGLFGDQIAWTVTDRLPDPPETGFDAERLEERAVENSLELRIARGEIEVARKRLGITKPLGVLSDLELGATSERDSDGEWSVGPSVAVPIPIFSQGQPAVAKARAELQMALNGYRAAAIRVRSNVRLAYARQVSVRAATLHCKNVVLPLRQTIVDETQRQYNGMFVGAFDLLIARREQVLAGQQYIRLLRDYWVASAMVEQVASGAGVGGMTMTTASPMAPAGIPANSAGGH